MQIIAIITLGYSNSKSEIISYRPPLQNVFSVPGTYTYTIPDNVYSITIKAWGAGGRGGSRTSGTNAYGGGGGGAFAQQTRSVLPGETYIINVGQGSTSTSAGESSWMAISSVTNAFVLAAGGNSVPNNNAAGALGGSIASCIGSIRLNGGNGAGRTSSTISGGGGSSAGSGMTGVNAVGINGGIAPVEGGNGGNGRNSGGNGNGGLSPGGGGGGAVRFSGSPAGGAGGNGQIIISYEVSANAGANQSQCRNSIFSISGNTPPAGYVGYWLVVSGNVYYDGDLNSISKTVTIPGGTSAVLRYTLTDGITFSSDDILLSNTTSCTDVCDNPVNQNIDVENEANATNFNLSLQSTPALLINGQNNPLGWYQNYYGGTPSSSLFNGAFYIKKTGTQGNPRSGNHFAYIKGMNLGASVFLNTKNLSCGKVYKISAWVAAFTNSTSQGNANFSIGLTSYQGGTNPLTSNESISLMAPASVSWNNLNWQRYEYFVTLDLNDLESAEFYFKSLSNTHGIVIDDVCITEISRGSESNAGSDISQCGNTFSLNANVPASGYNGVWSIVDGSASLSDINNNNSSATLSTGEVVTLRWSVSGGGASQNQIIHPSIEGGFESGGSFAANNWNVVNDATNTWNVGSLPGTTGGSFAAYVSNTTGSNYTYNNSTPQTSHFFRDVFIPAGETDISLSFNWKNRGEIGYDRILIFTAPTSVTPVAGVPSSPSTVIPGATLVGSLDMHSSSSYQNETIVLPASLAGTNTRIIFTWQNDNSVGTNPPAAIDQISIISAGPACSSYDDLVLHSTPPSLLNVKNAVICKDSMLTLIATGCSENLLWSTGDTTSTISVSPASSSVFSVTCTPGQSGNLILSSGFEDSSLSSWTLEGNVNQNLIPSHIVSGNASAVLNANSNVSSISQTLPAIPGELFTVSVWAKTNNSFANSTIEITFLDTYLNVISVPQSERINTYSYSNFTFSAIAPNNTAFIVLKVTAGISSFLYVDDVNLVKTSGCIGVAASNVTVLPRPIINFSSSNVNIKNGNDGSIDLFISSGTAPFIFNWSNGATTQNIADLTAGVYSVTVQDANECSTYTVVEIPVGHPGDCGGHRTQTQGGWGSNATGNNPGSYRDANFASAFPSGLTIGCTNTLVFTSSLAVKNFLPSGGSARVLSSGTLINPNNYKNTLAGQLVAATLSVGFDLVDPNFGSSDDFLKDLFIASGPFEGETVQFLLNEANKLIGGCGSTYTITEINDALTNFNENYVDGLITGNFLNCCSVAVTASGTSICIGNTGQIGAFANNGYEPYSYQWSNGLGNSEVVDVSPTTSTYYSVTITDDFGCQKDTMVLVNVNSLPIANISGTVTTCENNSVTLNASGGNNFLWSTGGYLSSINVNPSSTTTYTVTITDANLCTDTESHTITVYTIPIITNVMPVERCGPGSVTLSASSNVGNIFWYDLPTGGSSIGSGNTFTTPVLDESKTYYVASSNQGCISLSRSPVLAKINPVPNASASSNSPLIPGSIIQLNAKGGITYSWSGPNGFTSLIQNPIIVSATLSMAGTYTVTVTSANGCTASAQTEILINTNSFNWNFDCANGKATEIISLGGNCVATNNISITNSATVSRIYVEILYKDDNPGPTLNIYDASNISYQSNRFQLPELGPNYWVYRVAIPGTSQISYIDNTNACNISSIVVYVMRNNSGGTQSSGYLKTIKGENNLVNFTVTIPPSAYDRNVKIILPIADLSNNGRYLKISGTAGIASNSVIINGPNKYLGNCCLNTVELTLLNVPSNITDLNIEIDSRDFENGQSSAGQSWVMASAINIEAICCPAIPFPPLVSDVTICGQGEAVLSASGCTNGDISWYDQNSGGTLLGTGTSLNLSNNISNDTYYAECNTNNCVSERSAADINNLNNLIGLTGFSALCPDMNNVTISGFGGDSYIWNNGETTSSITVSPTANTTYMVTITSSLCGSSKVVPWDVSVSDDCCSGPIASNLIAKYNFNEGSGNVLHDVSGYGVPLNLFIENPLNVSWIPGCGLKINSQTTINSGKVAKKIQNALSSTNQLTLEAWIFPENISLTGPARIVSLSNGLDFRNLSLLQESTSYIIKRRIGSDLNGAPEFNSSNGANASLQHLVYTRDEFGTERFYINGELNNTQTNLGDFSNWSDFQLVLANELDENFGWLGTFYEIAIYNKAFSANEVTQNYDAGSTGECYNCLLPNCVSAPANPIVTGNARCGSGEVALNAIGPAGSTLRWFARSSGGTLLGTGSTYIAPELTSSALFYVESDLNGCLSRRTPVLAEIRHIPDLLITGKDTTCEGTFVSLEAIGVGDILWSNGSTQSSISLNPISTNNYSVTITGYNGCENSQSKQIYVEPLPNAAISGSESICDGSNTVLMVSSGQFYLWSNGATTESIVTSTYGTYTVTVTSVAGCSAISTKLLKINSNPSAIISGIATVCDGQNSTFTANGGETYLWSTGETTTAISVNTFGDYHVTVTDNAGCTAITSRSLTVNANPIVSISGQDTICNGSSTTFIASGNGSYLWSTMESLPNISVNMAGTYTVTVTNSVGCTAKASKILLVNDLPSVTLTGSDKICLGHSTTLSPSTGGTWISNNPTIASISNDGVVTGLSAGNVTFTYTNSSSNCLSEFSDSVTVGPALNASIEYGGSVCITDNAQLNALPVGGTLPYNYNWTGPQGFTGNDRLINILQNGHYYLTVTDNFGCLVQVNGFVAEKFEPFFVSLNSEICEGESVILTASGTSAISYLWSANAGNSISQSVNVTPSLPSSTFTVTVTNNLGCTAEIHSTIDVIEKEIVSVIGAEDICIGYTSQLSPSTGGIWTSSDPSIATVSNTGLITGQNAGFTSFSFQSSISNCISDPTIPIIIHPTPEVSVSGLVAICKGSSTNLSPNTGGFWTSSDPTIASVTNSGLVTGLSAGSVYFVFTSIAGCTSNQTIQITVDEKQGTIISGDNEYCINESSTLISSKGGGIWLSSDNSIATITNSGIISALKAGFVNIIYEHNSGACPNEASFGITIHPKPNVSIVGVSSICEGLNATLSPVSGGTWTSSNDLIATVNNSGEVTGISPGDVTFTFISSTTNCPSDASSPLKVLGLPSIHFDGSSSICEGSSTLIYPSTGGNWISNDTTIATITNSGYISAIGVGSTTFTFIDTITGCISNASSLLNVNAKPQPLISGPMEICIGSSTTILPSNGGSWISENTNVANISNSGLITGISQGAARFYFTDGITGCVSNLSAMVVVNALPIASIDYLGSICLQDSAKLEAIPVGGTADYAYLWSGPSAFTGNTKIIEIVNSGNYTLTITDSNGCTAFTNGFVYERFEPFIVNIQSEVCEGQSINLNVSANSGSTYQWSSSADNSTSQSINVTPTLPSSMYYVTVTSAVGCTAITSANILVNPRPTISLSGADAICIGSTTNLLPASGGYWSSSNPAYATITNAGVVTGHNAGTVTFTFTDIVKGCYSHLSTPVTIYPRPQVSILGPTSICINESTILSPSAGGIWTSNNQNIASISNEGVVIAHEQGISTFNYTNTLTGCSSLNSPPVIVNPKPQIIITGNSEICIGTTSQIMPSLGGNWMSNHPNIATVTNNGTITSLAEGSATFTFTDSSTGCKSDPSQELSVLPRPIISLAGDQQICPDGNTMLTPSFGGNWYTNNPLIATVSSSGFVTGVSQGITTFYFVSAVTNCRSTNSVPISVSSRPTVAITGVTSICVGAGTQLSPSSGGTWVSNNPLIASINNNGVVSGIKGGISTFKFIQTSTGCTSFNTPVIVVYNPPKINVNGSTSICINDQTTLTPNFGGTWISTNPNIAAVSNAGLVTGIATGTSTFRFTETATGCSAELGTPINVGIKPLVNLTGQALICIGSTTSILPSTGGNWSSTNPAVATISNSGLITGVSNGTVRFIFSTSAGCTSEPSELIIVNGSPTIIPSNNLNLCIGETTNFNANKVGVWQSNNPVIASIDNNGIVTGLAQGSTNFTFIDDETGCAIVTNDFVTVYSPVSLNILGASSICIGSSSQLSPTVGGIWTSLNPDIASISNSGLVAAVGSGIARFTYVHSSSLCASIDTISITIHPSPSAIITGSSNICVGNNTTLSPSTGGIWTSLSNNLASVTNDGVVTGLNEGGVRFKFTNSSTGCAAITNSNVVINTRPILSLNGDATLCIGGNTAFLPNAGGAWISSDINVATINNNGIVTGVGLGTARFTFTGLNTSCSSLPSQYVEVNNGNSISITGDNLICLGYTTQLSPSSNGYWQSSNPAIASVSSSGLVLGLAPGQVTFNFTDANSGCISSLPENAIKVINCVDPDFNVTFNDLQVRGDLSTNDDFPIASNYGQAQLINKPPGSNVNINIHPDGSYTFKANLSGVYEYKVPVCISALNSNCPFTDLVITVVDKYNSHKTIIANTDFGTTYQIGATQASEPIGISALGNDVCLNANYCTLSPSNMQINLLPIYGGVNIENNGLITYTSNLGYMGQEAYKYRICAVQDNLNCAIAKHIVTTNAVNALNSTVAVDDFYTGFGALPITGNVLLNDSDPENDFQTVISHGTESSKIIIPNGQYYLNSDGSFEFTPNEEFYGPIEILYTVCDNNVSSYCTNATLRMLILPYVSIDIRVYLEGALIQNGGERGSHNRPLMRDNLRVNGFTGENYLPTADPYSYNTKLVKVKNRYVHHGVGTDTRYKIIKDSTSVFGIAGENAIVDWVFVELRSKSDYTRLISTRSGLIQRDGDVVDIDGFSSLTFPNITVDSFYVVVRHRNHLGVMSMKVSNGALVDFTNPNTPVFNFGTSIHDEYDYTGLSQKSNLIPGYMAMWAGDFDGSRNIKFTNPNDDQNLLFFDVLSYPNNGSTSSNFNFGYGYIQGDYDMNGKVKYDNPNDDKNFLFSQILRYPLNTELLSNFNFFIAQVPLSTSFE